LGKILVVDDEKDIVEIISLLLQKDGHQTIPAYNGREALEMIAADRPDLIILDIMMPEMDGYAVHARLSGNPATLSIPIIVVTARAKMRDLFEVASNVVAYIEKPFDPKILREKVQEALAKK
jgi:CheY-like chemotaxis protein